MHTFACDDDSFVLQINVVSFHPGDLAKGRCDRVDTLGSAKLGDGLAL